MEAPLDFLGVKSPTDRMRVFHDYYQKIRKLGDQKLSITDLTSTEGKTRAQDFADKIKSVEDATAKLKEKKTELSINSRS